MKNKILNYIFRHYTHPNYLYLLIALLVLIIFPPFEVFLQGNFYIIEIVFSATVLISILYTASNKKQLRVGFFLGFFVLLFFWLNRYNFKTGSFNPVVALFSFSLFLFVFINLLRNVFFQKEVNINTVYASIVGYLLLGIMGAQLCIVHQSFLPNAFSLPAKAGFYDFLYFSYVSLTTIGYGDIVPILPTAKAIALLIGIFGQIYLTILIAIIIGKFLQNDTKYESN